MQNQPNPPSVRTQSDDEITLKDIFNTLRGVLAYWPYIVASMVVGVSIAFIVNRYAKDTYKVEAQVSVEEAENPLASAESALSIGFSFGGSNGILETRQAVLKSYAHNNRVARNLGWEVQHFTEGRLNRREVYPQKLYSVEFDPKHPQILGVEFDVELQQGGVLVSAEPGERTTLYSYDQAESMKRSSELDLSLGEYKWGEWIETDHYKFRIVKGEDPEGDDSYTAYKFSFRSYDAIAKWGMKNLTLSAEEKQKSSLLGISMEGNNRAQLADYINASIEELQRYELQQKNLMAVNTIQFIDGQLIQIESSLRNSEDALEEFRASNLIVDLSSESQQMLEFFIGLEQEKASLDLQRSFYRYVMDFLRKEQTYTGLSLPTLSSFNDPLVKQLAEQLITSSVQLEKYRYSLEGSNPAVIELEKEVEYTKQALLNATQNALSSSNIVLEIWISV